MKSFYKIDGEFMGEAKKKNKKQRMKEENHIKVSDLTVIIILFEL